MTTAATDAPRTLAQWLSLLEARHPVEIELGLQRIAAVAHSMEIGQIARRVVVVGGTNGKGSCVRTLEALALAAGLAVGTYTSPHLLRYNERVRIDGREVADGDFCDAFAQIDAHRGDISLTYFEVGTLAALSIMAMRNLDLAVLEVGLGGRYDAVNIIDADVSVLTSIALDHENWLGNSREAIGREKAGIARRGRPVICGDPDPPPALMTEFQRIGAQPLFSGRDFHVQVMNGNMSLQLTTQEGRAEALFDLPIPRLPVPSVAAALQCFRLLYSPLPATALREVLGALALPGRYQKVPYRGRTLVLDVAHNPAAAAYLAHRLGEEEGVKNAVVALMTDKDVAGFAEALGGVIDHWFTGDLAGVARALPGAELGRVLAAKALPVTVSRTIETAFDRALSRTPEQNILVICGSFFTISAIVHYLEIDDGI